MTDTKSTSAGETNATTTRTSALMRNESSLDDDKDNETASTSSGTTELAHQQHQQHHHPEDQSLRHLATRHHHRSFSSHHSLHLPTPPKRTCRIGILVWNTTDTYLDQQACRVMDHAISFCTWAALCVIQPPPDANDNAIVAIRNWLRAVEEATPAGYGRHADTTAVYIGVQGLADMLAAATTTEEQQQQQQQDKDAAMIDAVYVMVPMQQQATVVLQCLRAHKHVLIKDWQSTALTEFRTQVTTARSHQRFVQFSTMFDVQYNVAGFMDTILAAQAEQFGSLVRMQAELEVGPDDWARVGVNTAVPGLTDSCITRLARYCVLMGLLLTPECRPQTAQVTSLHRDAQTRVPLYATAKVWFGKASSNSSSSGSGSNDNENKNQPNRQLCLELRVGYSAVRTRQSLQVSAAHKYAVLTDFALPSCAHGASLQSFRVYDTGTFTIQPDTPNKACWEHVKAAEALDVPSGLPQHVMMWRYFAELCLAVESDAQWTEQATFLTQTAMALKATLLALETSASSSSSSSSNDDNHCDTYPAVPIQWD